MPPEEKQAEDRAICANFFALDEVSGAESILLFSGMGAEVDTMPLVEELYARGKRVLLPRCLDERQMEAREYRPGKLTRHRYGMLEPDESCPIVRAEEIRLAVVPGVCFDEGFHRLGRGGGFYDRFLARFHGCAVALCRERFLRRTIPTEAHDRPVEILVTERRVLRAEKGRS